MYSDPLALVRAAVETVKRADWHAAAALCDPVSLAAFRRQLLEWFAPATPRFELTVEDILRDTPDMPRAVAEFQVAHHGVRSNPAQRLREELPSVPDVAALQTLSPEAAFAAWLEGRSPRHQIERLASEGRISRAIASSAELSVVAFPFVVIGAVSDGDRLAHVLYRLEADDEESGDTEAATWLAQRPAEEQKLSRELSGRLYPQVITCRRQPDGGWLLIVGHDFLGMGALAINSVDNAERPGVVSDEGAV